MTILLKSLKRAQNSLTPSQRKKMEREQDIEHTYYSSALSGCTLDREEVERLCNRIK